MDFPKEYRQLLSALGTYLSKNFAGDPFIQGLMQGTLALNEQVTQTWRELADSAFRARVPVYHTELVYPIFLDTKLRNTTVDAVPKYDDPKLYFLDVPTNPNWLSMCARFGAPSFSGAIYPHRLEALVSVEKIVDNTVNPTVTLLPEEDFVITGGAISFKVDPCQDGLAREYFLINAKQDLNYIYEHFGVILGLYSKSSESYRSVVDSIFNAYVDGASLQNLLTMIKEVTGNPDDLKVIPYNRLNQKDDTKALLVPKRLLPQGYLYGLVFVNEDLPLFEAGEQLRFYLGGNANDVELFWRDFSALCERQGTTVNEVLTLASTQSRTAINPYRFFTENIGRYGYTLVSFSCPDYPTDLTVDHLPLRQLTPPWSALLLQQKAAIELETDITGEGGDSFDFSEASFMELNVTL